MMWVFCLISAASTHVKLVLKKDLLLICTLQNGGCLLIPRVVCYNRGGEFGSLA